jgi:MoaA/NifB/PqqE/SkfB family radical SAM enzyme
MKLSALQLEGYQQSRIPAARKLLCHAPFRSINFEQNGNATACCYNRTHVLGSYPKQSIHDIWFGEKAEQLRNYIRENSLEGGCSACAELIEAGNYSGTKAKYYDELADGASSGVFNAVKRLFSSEPDSLLPYVFEFELSNQCNLECGMCHGYFSSSIRRNREKLPAIPEVYDDAFVDQLEQFMSTTRDMKFLGGEPFMIDIYYKIWERIIQVNPDIRVHITTNGTFFNTRIRDLLQQLNVGIILSLDSLQEETYSKIRVNAKLPKVLANLEELLAITKAKNSFFSLAVCPVRINAFEMTELLEFANRKGMYIHFNVVWTPSEWSIQNMSAGELASLYQHYSEYIPEESNALSRLNAKKWKEYVQLIHQWMQDKTINAGSGISIPIIPMQDWRNSLPKEELARKVSSLIYLGYLKEQEAIADQFSLSREMEELLQVEGLSPTQQDVRSGLLALYKERGADNFLSAYHEAMRQFAGLWFDEKLQLHTQEVHRQVLALYDQVKLKDQWVTDIIQNGVFFQLQWMSKHSAEEVVTQFSSRYLGV